MTSNHVYKKVELTGSSTVGSDDAIRNAVEDRFEDVAQARLVRSGAADTSSTADRPLAGDAQGRLQARRLRSLGGRRIEKWPAKFDLSESRRVDYFASTKGQGALKLPISAVEESKSGSSVDGDTLLVGERQT